MTPYRTIEWQVGSVTLRSMRKQIMYRATEGWLTSEASFNDFREDLKVALDEAAQYAFGVVPPGCDAK